MLRSTSAFRYPLFFAVLSLFLTHLAVDTLGYIPAWLVWISSILAIWAAIHNRTEDDVWARAGVMVILVDFCAMITILLVPSFDSPEQTVIFILGSGVSLVSILLYLDDVSKERSCTISKHILCFEAIMSSLLIWEFGWVRGIFLEIWAYVSSEVLRHIVVGMDQPSTEFSLSPKHVFENALGMSLMTSGCIVLDTILLRVIVKLFM